MKIRLKPPYRSRNPPALPRALREACRGSIAAAHRAASAEQTLDNAKTSKSWRDKPDPIDESLINDGGTYDVFVAGGGQAGLFCATVSAVKG